MDALLIALASFSASVLINYLVWRLATRNQKTVGK